MAKNSAIPIGIPSRMRFSAPTDGFIWLDSISEIVELVTPARLASSRWEILLRLRTKRSRSPTSMLIAALRNVRRCCLQCCGSSTHSQPSFERSMTWKAAEKDLLHIIQLDVDAKTPAQESAR